MVERMPETRGAAEQPAPAAKPPGWGGRAGSARRLHPRLAKRMAIAAAVLLVTAAAAFFAWRGGQPQGPGPGFVSGNGRIEAIEVDIATRQAGRIAEILVDEGLKWRHQETWFGERVDPDFAEKRGPSSSSTPRRPSAA